MLESVSTVELSSGQDLLVLPPDGSGMDWCCLYTRPRHEKSLARVCDRQGIPYYLPLKRCVKHYRSGKKVRWLPLFGGYLFCCANPEQKYQLRREETLLSLLEVYEQEKLLEELREINKALAVSAELETVPYLAKGKKVRITSGPFRGITGTILDVSNRFRVMLNVTLINRSVTLEVDAGDVELVP